MGERSEHLRSSRLGALVFWGAWFVVAIAMLCVVAAVRGVFPFGAQSFLAEDLVYQYVDFFAWFKRVLAGQESVFYSTACGLGANTWGLYSYYLASPFNLLLPFFDEAHLTLFIFVADALKLGCMQLAAMFYLRRRFAVGRGWSGMLALGYTWCLWTATNLRNPMWLDALILLTPLQAIGCGFRAPPGFYSRVCVFVAPVLMWAAGWLWQAESGAPSGSSRLAGLLGSRVALGTVCAFVVADLTLGAALAWRTLYCGYSQEYHDGYVAQSAQQISDLEGLGGCTWRADRTFTRAGFAALNDEMGRGYMGISSYSSAHNQDALDFLSALGYSKPGQISVRYAAPVLSSDALLGVRYVCSQQPVAGETLLEDVSQVSGGSAYENPYALGLGYLVSGDAASAALEGGSPFERQNELASALVGHEVKLFRSAAVTEAVADEGTHAWDVTVPAGCLGYAYVDVPSGYVDGVMLDVDGASQQEGWRFQQTLRPFSTVEGGEPGVHRVVMSGIENKKAVPLEDASCAFYYLDLNALQSLTDELSARQATFDSFAGSGISGTATADSGGWLMVSVPHEAGWTVTVNGAQVETRGAFGDALTLVPVAAGENRFEMTFVSPGFVPGCVVSAAGALGLAAWAFWRRRRAGA